VSDERNDMIAGVANVWMPVRDVDRAKKFYSETLELSIVKDDGDWVEFEADGMRVALNGREKRGAGADGGPVLTFQPEGSLDDAVAGLKGRRVEFPGEVSEHEWGRVATFRDPDGNEIQLYEPPKN
jgi:predicted enzyme related to lactoylglutathione lyase